MARQDWSLEPALGVGPAERSLTAGLCDLADRALALRERRLAEAAIETIYLWLDAVETGPPTH